MGICTESVDITGWERVYRARYKDRQQTCVNDAWTAAASRQQSRRLCYHLYFFTWNFRRVVL